MTINSGFRTINHNNNVGGASNSQHTCGIVADIVVSGVSVSGVMGHATTSGSSGVLRYNACTHADSRAQYTYGARRPFTGSPERRGVAARNEPGKPERDQES